MAGSLAGRGRDAPLIAAIAISRSCAIGKKERGYGSAVRWSAAIESAGAGWSGCGLVGAELNPNPNPSGCVLVSAEDGDSAIRSMDAGGGRGVVGM